MVSLKYKIKIGLYVIGLFLIVFSVYWYLWMHEDISQFLTFAFIGLGSVLVGLFVSELENQARRLEHFRKQVIYIEEKVQDELRNIKKK